MKPVSHAFEAGRLLRLDDVDPLVLQIMEAERQWHLDQASTKKLRQKKTNSSRPNKRATTKRSRQDSLKQLRDGVQVMDPETLLQNVGKLRTVLR